MSCLFIYVYVTMLLVSKSIWCRIIGLSVNNEFERVRKEVVVTQFDVLSQRKIVGVPTKIRTRHLPNTSQNRYRLSHLAWAHRVEILKIIDFSDKLPATARVKEGEEFCPKFGNCYHSNILGSRGSVVG
jgi:hypothetical protein